MTQQQSDVLERELHIAARPEIVFAFFTDPAKMIRWMGKQATLDPRPGGICLIDMNGHVSRAANIWRSFRIAGLCSASAGRPKAARRALAN